MARGKEGTTIRTEEIGGPYQGRHVTNFEKKHWENKPDKLDNDNLNKALPASAEKALQKMFKLDENATQIRTDGQGKFVVQIKDSDGNVTENMPAIDVKGLGSDAQKSLEYHVKRHIISEHTGIAIEDLNQVKEIDGEYHYKDKDGHDQINKPSEDEKNKIDEGMSSLGINNKSYIRDSIGKGVLDHTAQEVSKNETDTIKKAQLEAAFKDGMVYDYKYNKKSEEYTFNVIPKSEITEGTANRIVDGEMKAVSIKQEDLPPEVKSELRYDEKKIAFAKEFKYGVNDIHRLTEVDGNYHFQGSDGVVHEMKPSPEQMKNIDKHLSDLGFQDDKRYISGSVGKNVIDHAIKHEADLDLFKAAALQKEIKDAMVYDYRFNTKTKEHEFYLAKQEEINGETLDGGTIKLSFNDRQYRAILVAAELTAAEKHIKLPDGKKIAEGGVKFNPNDSTKYLVTDTDEGQHSVLKRDVKTGIDKELRVESRKLDDIISQKTDTLVGMGESDDPVARLEKERDAYKNSKKWLKRVLDAAAHVNDGLLQAAQVIEAIESHIMQYQDNPNQQMPKSEITHAVKNWYHKKVKHHVEALDKKIAIHENNNTLGSAEGAILQHLQDVMDGKAKIEKKHEDMNNDEKTAWTVSNLGSRLGYKKQELEEEEH